LTVILSRPPFLSTVAVVEVGNLLHGLKVFDIHDDFHPFIMNVFEPFVQTHLMLEEALS
jgi:hypothetical protein